MADLTLKTHSSSRFASGLRLNSDVDLEKPIPNSNTYEEAIPPCHLIQNNLVSFGRLGVPFSERRLYGLKEDNPIYPLIAAEGPLLTPEKQKVVLHTVAIVSQRIKKTENYKNFIKDPNSPFVTLNLMIIMKNMWEEFIAVTKAEYLEGTGSYFHSSIEEEKIKFYECDSSALLMMAIGHELGIELSLVLVPKHAFLRENSTGMTLDQGRVRNRNESKEFYFKKFNITEQNMADGGYISLTRKQAIAHWYTENALAYKRNNPLSPVAKNLIIEALKQDSLHAQTYLNIGIYYANLALHHFNLQEYDQTISLIQAGLKMNPRSNDFKSIAYDFLFRTYRAMGNNEQASKYQKLLDELKQEKI